MKQKFLRALARRIAALVLFVSPHEQRGWAQAMAAEIACIEDDGAALAFAAGCLRVGCTLALGGWSGHALAEAGKWLGPRRIGLGCGAAATLLGCATLYALGAPIPYLVVQLLALLIGLSALPLLLPMLARAPLPAGVIGAGFQASAALGYLFSVAALAPVMQQEQAA